MLAGPGVWLLGRQAALCPALLPACVGLGRTADQEQQRAVLGKDVVLPTPSERIQTQTR